MVDLNEAIAEEVAHLSPNQLSTASDEISNRYRLGRRGDEKIVRSGDQRLAYLATRMPATHAAVLAVFTAIKEAIPDLTISSLLDLGAGPGTALWAAADAFPDLKTATLVEQDSATIEIGKRLAKHSDAAAITSAIWNRGDLPAGIEGLSADLVVFSYSLIELNPATQTDAIQRGWQAAEQFLAIIDPGTTHGFRNIHAAREQLIQLGAHIVAPCCHQLQCPLFDREGEWCHFSKRLARSSEHRLAKKGALGFEDEKYSYLVVSKQKHPRLTNARLIHTPQKRSGHINLQLCSEGEFKNETVSRKEGDRYRLARKLEWGDSWNCGKNGEEVDSR